MNKHDDCGVEVSAERLLVGLVRADAPRLRREFPNTAAGHDALVRWLSEPSRTVRVVMEATGLYGLDLALRLDAEGSLELMVANPRAVRHFAIALMERSKNDPIDTDVLVEFAQRMPFQRWVRPSAAALTLHALARRLESLTEMHAAEKNRLHAAQLSPALPAIAVLSPDLDVRQWVAQAGLDPRQHSSGSSVHKKPRISKNGNRHLRRALYMPALVAIRHEPHLRAFYSHLLARGKAKMQALVAVMRKLLHAIFGMFKHQQPFQGARLFALPGELLLHPTDLPPAEAPCAA